MTNIDVRVEPTRVLVAEDDREMRRLIANALREEGYEVIEAANGIELLDQLASAILFGRDRDTPHLVISDIRMPGVTGMEVLSGISESSWNVPIILITAFGDDFTHAQAQYLGAAAVFDKPFRLRELTSFVQKLRGPTSQVAPEAI